MSIESRHSRAHRHVHLSRRYHREPSGLSLVRPEAKPLGVEEHSARRVRCACGWKGTLGGLDGDVCCPDCLTDTGLRCVA